ncbi:ABC transporter substrate-binding protein [Aestuariivirga litoralis]|uniref:ABC transporter substrate-binding protein n=1 Tax=Aestuariivirga litoralis TaxID=2650924 RepID=UPI0018C77D26|nr:ABC transporter substrate-binding protein [Aestuariivirga litoralis]MBG1231981.1 ABC transporter substrate-binding protein [Aestuariivirga litoralis]
MKRFISTFVLALALSGGAALADSCPSREFAQSAATAIQGAARQRSPQAFINAASRYIDLNSLSLTALGKYRSQLTPAQQSRYLASARKFIGKFLVDNSNYIPTSGVSSVSCSGSLATVRFDSGASITFRLAGPQRVSDVLILGISVVGAMRSYFTGIIQNHNGDVNALSTALSQ